MTTNVRVGMVDIDQIDFHPQNIRRDLGDLRDLADSIRTHGVLQPVVLERRGERLRLRAGHRRTAASRLAGRKRIPAIVHPEPLELDEWLTQAVQENEMRRNLSLEEKVDTIVKMTGAGMTREGIAQAFGVSTATIRSWEKKVTGESVTVHESAQQVRAAEREERVADLTRQGKSAREIAALVGISQKHVVRLRTGSNRGPTSASRPMLRELTAAMRGRVEAGEWDAHDLIAALEAYTEDFTLPDHEAPCAENTAA